MLLQEHVAESLRPNVPDGWEKEMVVVERANKAEARRSKNAEEMRRMRHKVKQESSEPPLDLELENGDDTRLAQVGRHERDEDTEADEDSSE